MDLHVQHVQHRGFPAPQTPHSPNQQYLPTIETLHKHTVYCHERSHFRDNSSLLMKNTYFIILMSSCSLYLSASVATNAFASSTVENSTNTDPLNKWFSPLLILISTAFEQLKKKRNTGKSWQKVVFKGLQHRIHWLVISILTTMYNFMYQN